MQTTQTVPPPGHPLTNQDVVTLAQAGFDESFIILHIRTSHTHFDTSVEGLVTLKKAGLHEDIIRVMVAAEQNKLEAPAPVAAPGTSHSRGHWWHREKPVPISR